MIHESKILDLLGNKFPEINPELEKLPGSGNVYKSIQCFADFTKKHIQRGDMKSVRRCLMLAEKMLEEGTVTVKNAIENVFLFSLAPVLDLVSPVGQAMKEMLGGHLQKEYRRQTTHRGI